MTDILTIDFQADTLVLCDTLTERATGNGLIVCRCRFPPCPGHWTKFLQTVLVRPAGPVTARWRTLDAPENQTVSLSGTAFHLIPADRPVRIEWDGCDAALIVALTPGFVEATTASMVKGRAQRLEPCPVVEDSVMAETASLLAESLSQDADRAAKSADQIGVAFALRLFEKHGIDDSSTPHFSGGLGASRQRRITAFIDANLDRTVPLSEMARTVGLGRSHFGKAFHASFGRSPYQYLHERRVEKAKELLLNDRRTIVSVALDVGFSSHGHFTKVFRNVTGMTPSQFRRDRV
ncbi:helix-turn-helix domain-containing protein [Roseospira visakhapatnamensis]|uniref:AraC family transcriptional regulator n=1 Tax=Roseospira visakhapatnamensis TaxID=390880 RepID=A0A7W6WBH4_9PROT|nr:AraC family transcriptional regulator [Roseospira visakhapatnamensis]MBB4267843.1 AraC family transcriptional regulator [Roseospira visakhapatnamensis]